MSSQKKHDDTRVFEKNFFVFPVTEVRTECTGENRKFHPRIPWIRNPGGVEENRLKRCLRWGGGDLS